MSDSAEAGTTSTTVYRCPDETKGAVSPEQSPLIVDPGKTTDVERGSAEVPWFGPQPTRTADPIAVPTGEDGTKGNVARTEPAAKEAAEPAETMKEVITAKPAPTKASAPEPTREDPPKEEVVNIEPVPEVASEPEAAEPAAAKPKKKVKTTVTKRTKTKVAKRTKAKPAENTKSKPAEVAKAKPTNQAKAKSAELAKVKADLAKAKAELAKAEPTKVKVAKRSKTRAAKAEAKPDQVKTEPATDEKVIVWTRKDMSLGSRISNWFGF